MTEMSVRSSPRKTVKPVYLKPFQIITGLTERKNGTTKLEAERTNTKTCPKRKLASGKEGKKRSFAQLHLCDVCGKTFLSQVSLQQHYSIHTGTKPFFCEICDKGFSTPQILKEHETIHSNEKPYQCTICLMQFRQSSCLSRHRLTHSSQKPHCCHVCQKSFSQAVYLRSHLLTHTGEKRFHCKKCDKKFAHRSDLNRHNRRLHYEDNPLFACEVCQATFTDPSSRARHVKTKHGESKVAESDSVLKLMLVSDTNVNKRNSDLKHKNPRSLLKTSAVQFELVTFEEQSTEPGPPSNTTEPLEDIQNILLLMCAEDFVKNPDLSSTDYFNWLSNFSALCKLVALPLDRTLFLQVNTMLRSLAEGLSQSPEIAFHSYKNFLAIYNDLNKLVSGHLESLVATQ